MNALELIRSLFRRRIHCFWCGRSISGARAPGLVIQERGRIVGVACMYCAARLYYGGANKRKDHYEQEQTTP